jgi:hypothetical protein
MPRADVKHEPVLMKADAGVEVHLHAYTHNLSP